MFIWTTIIQVQMFFFELHSKEVFSCGMCRKNHRNMPKAVTKAVFKKKGDCVFRRDGPLLALNGGKRKRMYSC